MKPTTGPWTVGIGKHDGETPFITVFSYKSIVDKTIVAVTGIKGDEHNEQSMIDALFIAAAPELLEALKDCAETLRYNLARFDRKDEPRMLASYNNAMAAIIKATGSIGDTDDALQPTFQPNVKWTVVPEMADFIETVAMGNTEIGTLEEAANALLYKIRYGKEIGLTHILLSWPGDSLKRA